MQPSAYLPNNRWALGNYQNFAEMYIDFGKGKPKVVNVESNSQSTNANELPAKIFDGDKTTKWFSMGGVKDEPVDFPVWATVEYNQPVTFDRYVMTSGNDMPVRDPKDWTIYGSNDGQTFEEIDVQTGVTFSGRRQDLTFTLDAPVSYRTYAASTIGFCPHMKYPQQNREIFHYKLFIISIILQNGKISAQKRKSRAGISVAKEGERNKFK